VLLGDWRFDIDDLPALVCAGFDELAAASRIGA